MLRNVYQMISSVVVRRSGASRCLRRGRPALSGHGRASVAGAAGDGDAASMIALARRTVLSDARLSGLRPTVRACDGPDEPARQPALQSDFRDGRAPAHCVSLKRSASRSPARCAPHGWPIRRRSRCGTRPRARPRTAGTGTRGLAVRRRTSFEQATGSARRLARLHAGWARHLAGREARSVEVEMRQRRLDWFGPRRVCRR